MIIIREHINEKFEEDSDPIEDLGIGLISLYFDIVKTRNSYYFIEKGPNFVYKNIPTTYSYVINSGYIYRKHPMLYMAQELRSGSRAFLKNHPDKGPIPNNLNAAKAVILKNYLTWRKRAGLSDALDEGVADKYAERMFHIYDPETYTAKKIEAFKKIKTPINKSNTHSNEIIYKFNDSVFIVKNPTTLKGIQDIARGIVSKKGDLYVINFNFYIHTEIINALVKIGEIQDHPRWWHYVPENFITIQRLNGTNTFILGESNEVLDPTYNSGEYAVKWDMPEIEIARKYFIPFIKAAKKKNPQYKIIPKIFDEINDPLKESDQRKELEKKVQYITDDKNLGLKKKIINIVNDAKNKPVKICTVNGSYVKSTDPGLGFKEFVEGGHYYVDSYPGYKKHIPEDEIWIDDVFRSKPEEMKAIIQHEFIERNLMKYKKWSYSKAHEYANKKEAELRKKSKK